MLLSGAFVWPEVATTWPTLLQNVIAPHNASTFVFLTPDSTLLATDKPRGKRLITKPLGTMAPLRRLCVSARALMGAALTRCRAANLTLPRVWNDPVPHNAVQQYSKLLKAYRVCLQHATFQTYLLNKQV